MFMFATENIEQFNFSYPFIFNSFWSSSTGLVWIWVIKKGSSLVTNWTTWTGVCPSSYIHLGCTFLKNNAQENDVMPKVNLLRHFFKGNMYTWNNNGLILGLVCMNSEYLYNESWIPSYVFVAQSLNYRISSYSFRPWIVSAHLCTVTIGLIYCDLWISKFKKE